MADITSIRRGGRATAGSKPGLVAGSAEMDGLERGAKGHAERRVARRAGKASLPEDREERMEQRAWNRRSWLALAGAVSRREYEAGDLFEDADLA